MGCYNFVIFNISHFLLVVMVNFVVLFSVIRLVDRKRFLLWGGCLHRLLAAFHQRIEEIVIAAERANEWTWTGFIILGCFCR